MLRSLYCSKCGALYRVTAFPEPPEPFCREHLVEHLVDPDGPHAVAPRPFPTFLRDVEFMHGGLHLAADRVGAE